MLHNDDDFEVRCNSFNVGVGCVQFRRSSLATVTVETLAQPTVCGRMPYSMPPSQIGCCETSTANEREQEQLHVSITNDLPRFPDATAPPLSSTIYLLLYMNVWKYFNIHYVVFYKHFWYALYIYN